MGAAALASRYAAQRARSHDGRPPERTGLGAVVFTGIGTTTSGFDALFSGTVLPSYGLGVALATAQGSAARPRGSTTDAATKTACSTSASRKRSESGQNASLVMLRA